MRNLSTYVLITPARNEARFIEKTLISVVQQKYTPMKWVIVSDGSTDGTDEIVRRYAEQHAWIELVSRPDGSTRSFAAKVEAFNAGYARVADLPYEVIGNLDGDVSFEPDYLAFLLNKFVENPRLGVAGTPYWEENASTDDRLKSPEHVSGACQMFRRKCFEDIGGYAPIRSGGIDLVALLSAQAKGWETRRFDEKVCLHHKKGGSGAHPSMLLRTLNWGRKDYLLGSHPGFQVFRSAYLMLKKPYIIGGTLMLAGYMWAMLRRVQRTMPDELIQIRQRDQLRRLRGMIRHPFRNLTAPARLRPSSSC